MKCVTLTQPWASLVAIGAKTIETRSWPTPYRGPLAIHAARSMPRLARTIAERHRELLGVDPDELPRGDIIAVCELLDVISTEDVMPLPEIDFGWRRSTHTIGVVHAGQRQLMLGDFSPRRFAWLLADVKRLKRPVPARGRLGLWDFDLSVRRGKVALP